MTRDAYNRILAQMEQISANADEAESIGEERHLMREYEKLWKIVKPYADGVLLFSDEKPTNQ